jgi:hypothetical protein
MWKKLGYLNFSTCNDGDLLEWFIGYEIPIIFKKHFWPKERMDLRGTCIDLIRHDEGKPFEAEILIQQLNQDNLLPHRSAYLRRPFD